jgi:hypothetical protein
MDYYSQLFAPQDQFPEPGQDLGNGFFSPTGEIPWESLMELMKQEAQEEDIAQEADVAQED